MLALDMRQMEASMQVPPLRYNKRPLVCQGKVELEMLLDPSVTTRTGLRFHGSFPR